MEPESISDMLDVFERQRGSPFRSPSDSIIPTPYRRQLFEGSGVHGGSPLGSIRGTPMIHGYTAMGAGRKTPVPNSNSGLQDVLSMAASPVPTSFLMAQTTDSQGPTLASQPMLWESMEEEGLDAAAAHAAATAWASPMKPILSSATKPPSISHVFNLASSPVPAPTPSTSKRTLDGLGTPSRVIRTAKKIRAVTTDVNAGPISPSRRRTDPQHQTFAASMEPIFHQHAGTTSANRSVSAATLMVPPAIGRTASNSSFVSTSSMDLLSPQFGYMHTVPGTADIAGLPVLDSGVPSPNLSHHSPLGTPQMGTVIFTSPEQAQTGFVPDYTFNGAASQMMQHSGSGTLNTGVSNQMGSVGPQPPHPVFYPLSTITETPDLVQDEIQAPLPIQGSFPLVEYPPVPGLTYNPPDVQGWELNAQQHQFGPQSPNLMVQPGIPNPHMSMGMPQQQQSLPHPPHSSSQQGQYPGLGFGQPPVQQPNRNPSGPFSYEMGSDSSAIYQISRSASAPISFVASMPSMMMPQSTSVGGLYGPTFIPPPPPAPFINDGSRPRVPSVLSPDTPRKRQASKRFGNYIKPGPKPKPKGADGKSLLSSPATGSTMEERPGPKDAGPSSSSQSSFLTSLNIPSSSSSSTAIAPASAEGTSRLQIGPSLDEYCAQIQHTQRGTIILPPQPAQPVLTLQPARRAGAESLDSNGIPSGLPKTFIESLYSAFAEYNPQTGQTAKRFRCLIEGCERSFPRKSAIHSHIQTHLEDKPFVCDKDPNCTAAFVRQHDLRRHQRIHTGEKTHNCECGKIFARGDALHRHKLRNICIGGTIYGRPLMM